jgi:hypothetical protein
LIRERVDKDYELQELFDGDSDKKARPIIEPLEAWSKSQMKKSWYDRFKEKKIYMPFSGSQTNSWGVYEINSWE